MRITWPDGAVTTYPPYAELFLEQRPRAIDGRLYRITRTGRLVLETT